MCTGHDSSSVHPKEGERRKRDKEEEREREKEERGRKENVREKTAEDVKNDGGGEKKERNREITEHFYDTERENMSHHPP